MIMECWKDEPEERPDFSKLVVTISLTLEAVAGYMDLSLVTKDDYLVAAKVEPMTSVHTASETEWEGQQEAAVTNHIYATIH